MFWRIRQNYEDSGERNRMSSWNSLIIKEKNNWTMAELKIVSEEIKPMGREINTV